jgi:amino acid adenylation domain-containing protein
VGGGEPAKQTYPAYQRERHGVHLLARPEVVADPTLYQAAVRELPPVWWDEVGKVWVVSGYAEASVVLRDQTRFHSARLPDPAVLASRGMTEVAQVASVVSRQMLFLDPPVHTAIRAALQPSFSPAAVAVREATVRAIVDRLVDALPSTGRIDLVKDLAGPLPTLLIASRLGLDERIADLLMWADAYETMLSSLATLPHVRDRSIIPKLLEAWAALRAVATVRRTGSGEDLITALATALAGQAEGAALDDALDLVAANILVLLGGGYQTLTQLVAMGIVHLINAPAQLAELQHDPTLIDGVIDETMRLDGSSQYVARRSAEPVELAGQKIAPGESLVVLLAAANRDPRQFADPDRFDPRRHQGPHLGFSLGRHFCLGSVDAVQAARFAILGFVARYGSSAGLAHDKNPIVWGRHPNTRAPRTVLVDIPSVALAATAAPAPRTAASESTAASLDLVEAVLFGQTRRTEPWTPDELAALRAMNDRPVDISAETLWMDTVAELARRQPDAVAITGGRSELTYRQLDQSADVLAARLQDMGVEPGAVVGVIMDRAAEAYVSVLAANRAGAAFLVADTACPEERLRHMLSEAGVSVVCTQAHLVQHLRKVTPIGAQIRTVDTAELAAAPRSEPVVAAVRPGDTAYIVFTSGSTGAPKGISIDHDGVINLQLALRQVARLTPADRVLQWFPPNFDGWHFDLITALTAGSALVLAPQADACLGPTLTRVLRDGGITAATLTPTAWRTITPAEVPKLRLAALAGEVCSAAAVDRLAGPRRRVLNLYGPAEATVWTTWHECRAGDADPPIGTPIPNKRTYVLDRDGRPTTPGAPGQLWIAGKGVGRYLRQPDLMRQRFLPDPLAERPGQLMYATGDLCRWRPDGRIDYLGRADRQVKVRGRRVELEEIERVLLTAPGVRHATVTLVGSQLVATVVTDPAVFVESETRRIVQDRLLVVPSSYKVVADVNLSPAGKLDLAEGADASHGRHRATEPPPSYSQPLVPRPRAARAPARTAEPAPARLVWQVAKAFAACLELPQRRIRVDSDFFVLGGDSLSLAELLTRIEDNLDTVLEIDAVVDATTPEAIAHLVAAA